MTMRGDRQTFRNEDLVLKVTTNIDPKVWDETQYEAFLDELCGMREYQKEAIRTTLRYLIGGKYANLRELAKENFNGNDELQQRYGSWANMEKHLQLPDQLSCSIDLATATGKSWVLYGIAAILLAEGAVDRVLVLCPSNTIEAGLIEKFRSMAGDANLRDVLPPHARVRAPKIINASETIVDESICVENYHAILAHVKSSIRDSLESRGQRVAVLNDETHHVANEKASNVKKWKEFLLDPAYGFRIVVGVSGTCYVGDDYFADVISRYSLRQAIEERFVKKVEYVAEMPDTNDPDEKWQLIYNRHQDWKKKLKKRGIRPLAIIVTKSIADCDRVADELISFLEEWEKISSRDAERKVLPVSSGVKHQPNVARLRTVDTPVNTVEWIVSVSMLSEGWDVKNVFQIVPHEERAFNSKLLIAQVLGRGLRRPEDWKGEDPMVTVFNHDAWSTRIRHLVNEILEIERRLTSAIVSSSPYHFNLHNLDYTREEEISEHEKRGEYRLLEDGYVDLPSQVEAEDVTVEFERAVSGDHAKFKTQIAHKTYSAQEVAEVMFNSLRSIDEETKDAQ
jgi:type III restriction enzyme